MQIFQTNSPTRWKSFKWLIRLALFFLLLSVTVIAITLWRGNNTAMPRLISEREKEVLLDTTGNWMLSQSNIASKYKGFRSFIDDKGNVKPNKHGSGLHKKHNRKMAYCHNPITPDSTFNTFNKFPAGIRSAFFVDWDAQSLQSLQENVQHLNLVLPEWLFINPTTEKIEAKIDTSALNTIRKAGIKVMPMLSNNYNGDFNGNVIHHILSNTTKRQQLINDLVMILQKNHFDGVNIDFEDLKERKNEVLTSFQKQLYTQLHASNLLVTQDIAPFNEDYDAAKLAQYNDYIFLMAYDQFSESTQAGPIAHQKWVEAAVDKATRQIPANKLILAIAGYGYDWTRGKRQATKPVTYQQALTLAREFGGNIDFDNDSYNLHFTYTDNSNVAHDVQFTDAATIFNELRFASEDSLSGVALWRLGAEDSRMWKFYDRDMTAKGLRGFDFNDFAAVHAAGGEDNVDYEGEGEILDIVGQPADGHITPEVDSSEMLISEESYDKLPSKWVGRKYGSTDKKKLVLTFDDGPDPTYTPQVLDILKKEHVPAAFFLVGINAENNIPLVKRIYNEGHEIGDHTFTHPNIAKVSTRRAVLEMESTRLLIECITGHSTVLFRAPYNADFEPQKAEELIPVAIAHRKNFVDVGESLDPEDWEPGVTADSIVARVIRRKEEMNTADLGGNIILLHDAGGDSRKATIEALPRIIHYFKAKGYTFTTISDMLGKPKEALMPPVPEGSGYFLVQCNYFIAAAGYWVGYVLFSLFVVFIVLSMARLLFLAYLAVRQRRKEKQYPPAPGTNYPLVSVIVPAYNESVNAVSSMQNLLRTTYPNIEIIFVDDGSKDDTYEKMYNAFHNNDRVKVYTKPNGGKASALNFGISQSVAEFVVCIDADTRLLPDAISKMMQHFTDPKTGAVAGNVKVGNEVNMLTKWQAIEYITSQNFDRKAFAYLNAITVVPGAIGAFRKQAIAEAGGFTTDTLAEDCDLTIRLLRAGYAVTNEKDAQALTEAPESTKMFIRQRFRWSYGVMQTFWKHRDVLFNNKYKALGWVAFPNILLFQFIIPTFAPIADIIMITSLFTGNAANVLLYYGLFMLVDAAVAILAFSFEKESKKRLVWMIPQRIVYRWLMLFVLFKAFLKAIKGEWQGWGVLKRTGRVKDIATAV